MKKPKKRARGGASYPCPDCGGTTHVVITRRVQVGKDKSRVVRKRECQSCGSQFKTEEKH
jgi:transcriptional regulator NrdR family protein